MKERREHTGRRVGETETHNEKILGNEKGSGRQVEGSRGRERMGATEAEG